MYQKQVLGYTEALAGLQSIFDRVSQELSEGKGETTVSVAVVDDHGDLVAAMRMDGASSTTMEYAIKKARSAALTRRDTIAEAELLKTMGLNASDFGDFVSPLSGGLLITKPGVDRTRKGGRKGPESFGGIGCSGREPTGAGSDEELAWMGLKSIQKAIWSESEG